MRGYRQVVLIGIATLAFAAAFFSVAWADGAEKDFTIKNQQVVTPPQNDNPNMTHWLFVKCDHWAGCYMPCRGGLKACMKVAHEAEWTVLSIHSRVEDNLFEANSLHGPVPLPSRPRD